MRAGWGLTVLLLGCTGQMGASEVLPELPTNAPPTAMVPVVDGPADIPRADAPGACSTRDVPLPPSPLRLLSAREYDASVRDLLGTKLRPASNFPAREVGRGFDNDARAARVSPALLERYLRAAEALADDVVARLSDTVPCPAPTRTCAHAFVQGLAARAWRRPITAAQATSLRAVYDDAATVGHAEGIRAAVQAILASPRFVYRFEPGGSPLPDGRLTVDDHAMAARLSYLFLGTVPSADPPLVKAAAEGRLRTAQDVATHAARLAADPRAHAVLADFASQWFDLPRIEGMTKSARAFPTFDAAIAAAMRREADRFLQNWLWKGASPGDHSVTALLRATFSFPDASLIPVVYGDEARTPAAPDLRRALDPRRRAGILTLPGLLAAHAYPDQSSPIHRGLFVRERLLCQELPPPPPDLAVAPPPVQANVSTRARFDQHRSVPACAGCHALLDPVGYGFESFDALGRFRTTDGGQPIDDRGELAGVSSAIAGRFQGAVELGARLAGSQEVRTCIARQWFRYAVGRLDTEGDRCDVASLSDTLASSADVRRMVVALTGTRAFLTRTTAAQEAAP